MDRATYVATSAGLIQFRKIEVVNGNLANINTPGFKKQILVADQQSFDQTLASEVAKNDPFAKGDHDRSPAAINIRTTTDFTPGPIKNTGNVFDVALRNANDFFVINTDKGPQYTRAGNFTLSENGEIVTADGYSVSGDGGAITADGPGVSIAADGSVRSRGEEIGRLQVVRVENPDNLERVGMSRFTIKPGFPAPEPVEAEVIPQSLEMSNVTAISSVIDLITANRAFEMYSKSMQTIGMLNQTTINQVGKPR